MKTVSWLALLIAAFASMIATATRLPAAEAEEPVAAALHLAVSRRIADARKWLDGRDFKSLAQTADGLQMLAGLLKARGRDEPWQAATGKISLAALELNAAARGEELARAQAALVKLDKAAAAAQRRSPTGPATELPPASGGPRSIMLVMEGIRGDAKIDLLTGDVEKAKTSAYVLSELGRLVSNSAAGPRRDGQQWSELSSAFIDASLEAARSPATDAATVRQLLRKVSQRCDACHETR